MVIKAMTILLKSLPFGTKFNICSFGSNHSFLWPRSQSYNEANLSKAISHINAFKANFGGTQMHQPVQDTISQRFSDMLLDTIILTDGEIWNQDSLFDIIRQATTDYKCRFFSLGIGSGASTALVEGIATAGNGFSQFVVEGEKMDAKMIRLLKGALTPHIDDYSLEVKYKQDDEEFEVIDTVKEALRVNITAPTASTDESAPKPPISFFDPKLDPDFDGGASPDSTKTKDNRFAHLPIISPPSVLQAPCRIPPLYAYSRTTVYLLLDPSTYHRTPQAVILRATCPQGPLELEIEVEDIGKGETVHQLAAKKAVFEIEKNGGWLVGATDKGDDTLIKNKYEGRWDELVEREAVHLGIKYQIAGKWCSFVALEGDIEHEAVVFGSPQPVPLQSAPGGLPRSGIRMAAMAMPIMPPQAQRKMAMPSASSGSQFHSSTPPAPSSRILRSRSALGSAMLTKSLRNSVVSSTKEKLKSSRGGFNRESTESPNAINPADKMYEIISLQKSDGSWEWDKRLVDIVGIKLDAERRNAIVATALAIAFLQVRMAQEAESWELIVEKARRWLGQQQGVDADKEINDVEKLL